MVSTSFERIAIVNRGEPAMRLIHAVRELNQERAAGLVTIALYTEPDARSLFVREADETVLLGPATFVDPRDGQRKSKYLDYAALEEALRASRAQAAWVGWGFVAEHAEFADLCARLGIVFIGPEGDAMRRVGDKIASKRLAEEADVPVAPWSSGPVESAEDAARHAERLGLPVMIKATAGGGGRGVRRVSRLDDLAGAFESARSEALKSFGDATVFVERAIVGARHVEVQVVADHHGTHWAVGVRDCTVQRRNQKVVEEAPSPVLTPDEDAALRAAAVRLTRAAGYRNAGTVEFLFEPAERAFYFMEINTRLQVEHPVTEATTGLDLVKLQLHIAGGGRLEGEPPKTTGHAIEVRLNAEDPDHGFAPAPGRIDLFRLPTGPGLRIDAGVQEGDVVAPDFDSMVAKLIAYGKDRPEALGRLRRALLESAIVVRGGSSNKAFLLDLLAHPDIASSRIDIGWLDRLGAEPKAKARPHAAVALVQAAIELYEAELALEKSRFLLSAERGRPAVREEVGHAVELRYGGQTYALEVRYLGGDAYRVRLDGVMVEATLDRQGPLEAWITCDGLRHRVVSVAEGAQHVIEVDGVLHRVSSDQGGAVRSPSPAITLAVHVAPGDVVAAGDRLVVLEAMKTEMLVSAPTAGRVRDVLVRPNVQVAAGAPLVVIEASEEPEAQASSERVTLKASPDAARWPANLGRNQVVAELHRFLMGFDVTRTEAKRVVRYWAESQEALPMDAERWALENACLQLFADVLALYHQDGADPGGHGVGAQEQLLLYLRAPRNKGKGLPAAFAQRLRAALRHHGVDSLEWSPALEQALLFIHRAHLRTEESAARIFDFLDHRLRRADSFARFATAEFRALLDQLIAVTRGRYQPLNDIALEARYRYFDRAVFEAARDAVYGQMRYHLEALLAGPSADGYAASLKALVECPQPMLGALSSYFVGRGRLAHDLALEVAVRRLYRLRELTGARVETLGDRAVFLAEYTYKGEGSLVMATYAATPAEVGRAVADLEPLLRRQSAQRRVDVEIYVAGEAPFGDVEDDATALSRALAGAEVPVTLGRVCVGIATSADPAHVRYFVHVPEGGRLREDVAQRGVHPMVAERFELWRLSNFKVKPLRASDDVHLYHAVAHDNPKDERLFAFVEVRDLTPVRNARGEVVELPHLERMFLEAIAGVRAVQAQRPERERLLWNRLLIYVWPVADLSFEDVMRVAWRIAPAAKSLGFEKAVVRLRLRDASGELRDTVLHLSNRSATGLHAKLGSPSDAPIRPLTAYAQRVIQLRRVGLTYAYEIVRMLTPGEGDRAEFPRGTFAEHDLDAEGRLVPVDRPPGENRANVVVGVIRSHTARHPEGLTRVLLLGDASRDMGALAEPECRRILAAIDLAERLRVPLEWFPVSSGAKIAMDVGTEGLDWVARVLRRLVEFTQAGHEVNLVVTGVNVGGQSYWNAEATMLMHTRGILVMTPEASMVLTGKRALDISGGVSASTNQEIGGVERIMGYNGQAQYAAKDVAEACHLLLRYYDHTYVAPGERFPRRVPTSDPIVRDVCLSPHTSPDNAGFTCVGDIFSNAQNPGRKKPFDIRSVMRAAIDQDHAPLERWQPMRGAETAVIWDAHLGGMPVCLIGIESRPLARLGFVPGDGPDTWTGGTLFPLSSKKVARAIHAASGNRPVVVLANLSGFDGSPESMRELQLEYGAEIGRAVVNFDGPILFTVISRYHGGAYVVFSCALNENLEVAAVEGSYASVIGGAPAAAVVFPAEVKAKTLADPRVAVLQAQLAKATDGERVRLLAQYDKLYKVVYAEKQGEVAERFDAVHSVHRAKQVGSLHHVVDPHRLRPYLVEALERGVARVGSKDRPRG